MSCQHVVRQLWDYLDNELDDELRRRVRAHLDACEHCLDHFTFEGAFLRVVASHLDEVADTRTLREQIVGALRLEGYRERAS